LGGMAAVVTPPKPAITDDKPVDKPVAAPSASSGALTAEQAIAMQEDLISSYSDPAFQTALRGAYAEANGDKKKFAAARKKITMDYAQGVVLPKYGFEATPKGVALSMQAFMPHNNEPTVAKYNATMTYLIEPEMQDQSSLDQYLSFLGLLPFTLERAISMQEDLITKYQAEAYQTALRNAYVEAGDNNTKFKQNRAQINLEFVQAEVLPRYGFEPTPKGAQLSNNAFGQHFMDPTIGKYAATITYLTEPKLQDESGGLEKYLEMLASQVQASQA